MWSSQVYALGQQLEKIRSMVPQPPVLTDALHSFTDMDLSVFLKVSCLLWVIAPESRLEGYAILKRAVQQVRYATKGPSITLSKALMGVGWNRFAAGQRKGLQACARLLNKAFRCHLPGCQHRPCTVGYHRAPDAHYLRLAILALMEPAYQEDIVALVMGGTLKGPKRSNRAH
jgi:hypothetical protein